MYAVNGYLIRKASEADVPTLQRLAQLDCQRPLSGAALVAELGEGPAAAISLANGRVIADPFQHTAVLGQLLRMHFRALRAHSCTTSLRERIRHAVVPFRARPSEA